VPVTTTDSKNKGFMCHGCHKRVPLAFQRENAKVFCPDCDPLHEDLVRVVPEDEPEKVG